MDHHVYTCTLLLCKHRTMDTLQDVVNDPNASDAIAKSVDSSKNRYLNTRTCEMSCTVHMNIKSHDLT